MMTSEETSLVFYLSVVKPGHIHKWHRENLQQTGLQISHLHVELCRGDFSPRAYLSVGCILRRFVPHFSLYCLALAGALISKA